MQDILLVQERSQLVPSLPGNPPVPKRGRASAISSHSSKYSYVHYSTLCNHFAVYSHECVIDCSDEKPLFVWICSPSSHSPLLPKRAKVGQPECSISSASKFPSATLQPPNHHKICHRCAYCNVVTQARTVQC